MENKSNPLSRAKRKASQDNERILRFSIRKYSFGAASVAVAALMFLGARASVVQADTTVNATEVSLDSSASNSEPSGPVHSDSAAEGTSEAPTAKVDKTQLQAYYDKLTKLLAESDLQGEAAKNAKTLLNTVKDLLSDDKASSETVAKTEKVLETTIAEVEKALAKRTEDTTAPKPESSERAATPSGENREVSTDKETVAKKDKLKSELDNLTKAIQALPEHETTVDVREKANAILASGLALLEAPDVTVKDIEDMTKTVKRSYVSVMNATTRLASGRRDPRNNQRIPEGIQFRAEIAYAPNANGTAYGNENSYITSSVNGSTDPVAAQNIGSKVMNYRARYNVDETGKITSIDWLVYFNDYLENLENSYNIRGEVYRNYIQIPKEVNMPTKITRLKYTAERKFGRPVPPGEGEHISKYVTFNNLEPGKIGKVPLSKKEDFSRDSWNAYTRGYDSLTKDPSFYFKDAATDVGKTKALIDANALPGERVIWDQSNTGGNLRDGYVWEFTTTVPKTTTNEQLKNMKAVMGMFRTGTAGNTSGIHTFATNPVNLSKADTNPPTVKTQTVKVGQQPDAKKSIGNFDTLPAGTKAAYTTTTVNTSNPGTVKPTVRVTYPDGSTVEKTVDVIVKNETVAAPVVNTKSNNTIYSTDNEITGTGTAGSTIKVTVKDQKTGAVLSEKTTKVGQDGNWKLTLDKGLNSNEALLGGNEASRTFYAPKNPVEVVSVTNGIESEKANLEVSIGESKILPSEAAKDKTSVVAGAKKVVLTVPHDTGYSYFWYKDKETNSAPQVTLKRGEDRGWSITEHPDRATIESVKHGDFVDTITLTLTKPVAEGENNMQIISHNGRDSHGSYLNRYSINVTNEKPVVSSATNSDVTTVTAGGTVDLSTLAKVTDHEDDQNATLGTKGKPTVVSINGDTRKTTLKAADLAAPGTYVVKYKAVDSQGKESAEYTHTVKVNQAPTVEVPYSNAAKRQIYVYTGEKTDLTFTGKDETEVKDLYLRGPVNTTSDNAASYGLTTGKVENGAVTGEGTVSADKRTATIKMTGTTNLPAGEKWTSFIEAKDSDNAKSMTGVNYNVENDDDAARQQKPGYVQFIVKSQTDKYDIKTPTEKVAVTDPANVTEADLAKIKEKLQLEYKQDNDDANIAKNTAVDKNGKIQSVEKEGNNLVVTYTDGSTDTKPLSEFVKVAAPVVNTKSNNTIYSTDNEITGTGTAGSTIKVTVKDQKTGAVLSEKTTKVGQDGNWKLTLDKGLNSNEALLGGNEASRTFYAPKNPVEVVSVTNGIESEKANLEVSIGESKILPSEAAKDKTSVVAGAKKVVLTVPHDTGYSYFWYKDKETNSAPQVTLKRGEDRGWSITEHPDRATIESVKHGDFVDTITLTLTKPVAEGENNMQIISHNGRDSHGSYLNRYSINVTNEKPVVSSATNSDVTTVTAGGTVDLSTLAKVTDHEDDQNATLGTKGKPTVVSINGDTRKTTLKAADLAAPGTYVVKYKAVDSQGKESAEYTHTVKVNQAPTVEVPYSNAAKRQIYVYTGEKTDLTFTGKDETEVKDLYLRGPVNTTSDNAASYGLTTGKVENGAVTGEGTVSADKRTATIKMTGTTNLPAGEKWTSFIEAKDSDNAKSMTGVNYNVENDDDAARQQKPGYVQFIVKSQTDKYDIKTPTEKVAVTDPANVTEADLAKIKEKLQLEYKQDNDDANIAKNTAVDKNGKIQSVEKEGNNLVVTYTDGSTDTKPLSEFVTKDTTAPETPVKPVTPAKTEVKDPKHLTDKEKDAVKDKVEKANPGKNVTVDDQGNATVTDPTNGSSATIPSSDLVEKAKETPETPVKPVTPAKTEVKDPKHLTDKEKDAVKDKVEKANPGKNVTVDDQGNATVTDPTNGSSATIPSSDLVEKAKETPETPVKPVTPAKTEVKDPKHLTDKEKDAVKDKVEKANPGKNVTVDDQGNATVTDPTNGSSATIPSSDLVEKAKETPETPVKPVTPAKTEVKDPKHLTDKEKDAVKDKVEKANPGKNVTVDDQGNATVTDPTNGSSATIPSSDLVEKAKETPETPVKPVTPAKTEVKDPKHLTDKEKDAVKDKVEKANPGKNVTVDDQGNATVTDPTNGSSATIPSSDLVEKAKETPETPVKPVTPAKTEVKDPKHLTDKEKDAVKDKVEKANPGKNVTVDDQGNATVTDPTNGSSATIPSSDLVEKAKETPETPVKPVTPAKTEVKDPKHLTDKEKDAVKDKVEKANPGKNVTVDDQGNATVTDPTNGSSATIPSSDLVEKAKETPETPVKPVTPAKTEVKDPKHLTDKEKDAVKDKVEKANPGKNVTVDDQGNATVTDPTNGSSATIPSSDLVEKAKETPETPVKPVTPAKTEVKDPKHLTDKEKDAVKDKVEKANPGKNVTVDDQGNATVTDPTNGSSATIPSSDLVEKAKETPETPVKPVTPAKTEVKDPKHLTDKEKDAVKDKVEKANPGKNVTVDDQGNATVTDPTNGSSATIPSSDLVEKAKETPETPVKPVTPAKTEVKDPKHLTDKEKDAVKDKVEKANPGKNVTVDDQGNATVTDPTNGSSATIPSSDLVEKAKETPETPVKPVTPAKTEVKDPKHLTDKEKDAVKDKVEKANPGKNVTVDDQGNATVTDPTNGSSATIPSSDLVEKAKETPETPVKPVTPAKTEVKDPKHLTDKEKDAVKDKVEKANPGKNVTVDDQGNATVTDPTNGSSATIPSSDLVEKAKETPETPVKPVTPAKTEVKDPKHLTDKEKDAVKDKVEKANPGKNVTVDDQGNATVTDPTNGSSATIPSSDLVEKAKETPETPVKPVTPAKTEVKDPKHLTDKEKDAVKDKVEKANPGKNVTVDDQGNATVTDPTNGSSATIPSSDLVEKAKETPETPVKPVTPAKTEVKDPKHLTDKEKDAVKDKVEKANPGKNVTVDDQGNATVTDPTNGSSATIPSSDLVEKAKETPETPVKPVTPAKTEVKDPKHLTDKEKDAVKDKVEKANPGKNVTVDDQGNATVTDPTNGSSATIPSSDLVEKAKETPETPVKPVTPAKTEVKDPKHLTDKEKDAVKDKVEKANPGKNVTVDDQGNATVTDPTNGSSATIPSSDLVEKAKETPETPVKPVTPAKTEVKDPKHLTDKEKDAVKDKVEKANPGKNVTVDDQGNATVTDPTNGSSATIPSSDLVEKAKETPETPVKPVTPAKTEVKDPKHLTDKEKDAVKDKVEKANPGKNVTVDDQGNATVTDPTNGSSATIPSSDLVEKAKETPETPVKPVTPAKTEVKDPKHLTDKEKDAVKDKVEKANPGKNVTVDDQGNATVTDPTNGSSATIPSSDLVEKAKETPVKPVTPAKTEVKDPKHLTDKEKDAVKDKVEKANPGKNVTVDDQGNATVTDPTNGSSATIPSSDLVEKAKETPETPVKPVTPAKTEVKDPKHLTDKEKDAVKDKVEKANPGKNVTVDDQGNATVTDPTNGSSATIPSSDLVEKAKETPETPVKPVTPAKTEVKDPKHLTDKEKDAVKDKVEKANPGKNVTVDDQGNATVTDPTNGSSATIPSSDLVEKAKETPETPVKPVTPAKTEVKDPKHLTDKEKDAVKDKVEKANPGKNVTVDDQGNATVTDPTNGSSATIPSSDLVEKAKETPETPVKPVTPAKTEVKDPKHLTDKEKDAVKDKVEKANPGKNVTVDDQGNATVTDPTNGSSATIPSSDLVEKAKETPETPVKPVTPAKTEVKDPKHLTDKEKDAVKDKVEKANPGKNVTVDDQGNATVTDPTNGSSATIPSSDLVEKAKETPETPVKPVTPAKTEVKDPKHLTDKEKDAVKDKVEKANPGKNVTVDDQGNATVTDPTNGSSATIPSSDLVEKAKETPETPVKPVTPAKTEVKDPKHLTDKEKDAVKDKVEKANPGKNVTVDDQGNATVTDPTNGSSATIPSSDLVEKAKETPETPVKPVTPAKTEVKDPKHLTDKEKDAVKDKVEKANPGKNVTVDDQGNATVTDPTNGSSATIPSSDLVEKAKETPETPVKPVTPAKTEVKDPKHLTDKEKDAVKDKVEKANPGKNVTVDDQGNATVTDPTNGSSATIPSSDLVEKAKETPETPVKPVTPAKTEVKDPKHLTDKEKDAVKDKVEKANPGKNVTVDDQGNATVTDPTNGSSATIPSSDLVEKAKETPETPVKPVTPAKTEVKDPKHLTDKEKDAVKDKVEKANPGKNVTVDDQGNATVTDPTNGSSATIPSSDLVEKAKETPETPVKPVTPAKTEVKDPKHLTDKEKDAVKDKVEKANPGKNVTVDDQGNATVTDPTNGSSATIPSSDLVEKAKETPETPVKPVTPAKTEVKDPKHLTDKEKDAVKDKVEKANPGKNVTVDDQGNATVTDPTNGSSATIPSSDLVEKAKETPVKPVTPAKTEVKDPKHLTDKEKDAVKDKVEKANPGKNVTVDDQGNATVTDPTNGSSATIPSSDLVEKAKETPETPVKPVTPAKTEVKDPKHLTDKEKDAVKDKVEKANPGKNVTVDDQGNATVTDPTNGSSATIPSSDLVEKAKETPETPVKPVTPAKTEVKDPKHLTDKEKDAVKDKVEKANPGKNVTVDDQGNATVTDPTNGSSATIPSSDLVEKAKETPETPDNDQATAQTNTRRAAKELPNTGTADSAISMVAAAASALLGLGLAGRRRKEDEE